MNGASEDRRRMTSYYISQVSQLFVANFVSQSSSLQLRFQLIDTPK